MYRVEGKQCENEVDLAELQAALENSFAEHRYFLDLESGMVVLVTDETSRELEDVYAELPEDAVSTQVVEAIRRRPLQDWQIEELLQADQVEKGYGTRYIRVEPRDPHADYHAMEDFTPSTTPNARQCVIGAALGAASRSHYRVQVSRWLATCVCKSGRGAFRYFKTCWMNIPASANQRSR